jgi:hypothetical protein
MAGRRVARKGFFLLFFNVLWPTGAVLQACCFLVFETGENVTVWGWHGVCMVGVFCWFGDLVG